MADIYFNCSACGSRLAVEARAAGSGADCPHCGAMLRVPRRSTLTPGAARILRWGGAGVGLLALFGAGALALMAPGSGEPASGEKAVQRPRASERLTSRAAPAAERDAAPAAAGPLRAGVDRDLAADHAELQRQFEDLGNWVLQNVRGKFPLPDRMVDKLSLDPVGEDFGLHPDVIEVLRVQPQEKVLADDALQATREALDRFEASMLTVTQTAPSKVTVYIPAYAEEGNALREDLYAALEKALGSARFGRLLEMTDEKMEERYHYFGSAQRTLVFEEAVAPDNPQDTYLVIKDGWILPQGESSRAYKVSESSVRELPPQYLAYLQWLPDYVAAYAKP